MGYTHGFMYLKASLSVKDWTTLTNAVKNLIANLPEHSGSAGGYHIEDPLKLDADTVVSKHQIAFNGDGDLGCETFVLDRSWRKELQAQAAMALEDGQPHLVNYFNDKLAKHTCREFCKTERKPYDLVVCGVLAVAIHLFPEWIAIDTNGEDGYANEWEEAVAWAAKVTGYDLEVPPGIKAEKGTVHADGAVQVQEGV